ncbi:hypothetical protein FB451DRAFT_1176075 [Mycena latifolia]|nr:hypothetical protein FB451DRAFT_1176075 [Mycena latifolia]
MTFQAQAFAFVWAAKRSLGLACFQNVLTGHFDPRKLFSAPQPQHKSERKEGQDHGSNNTDEVCTWGPGIRPTDDPQSVSSLAGILNHNGFDQCFGALEVGGTNSQEWESSVGDCSKVDMSMDTSNDVRRRKV